MKETWWSYSVKQRGMTIRWNPRKKKAESMDDEPREFRDDGNEGVGKYSTMQDAVLGFLHSELSSNTKVKIAFDENDNSKFKFTAVQYLDASLHPVDDFVVEKWKQGKISVLWITEIEARIIYRTAIQASVEDYSKIMDKFSERIIAE